LGKSARLDVLQAYHEAEWSGLLERVPTTVRRSGWSELSLRSSVPNDEEQTPAPGMLREPFTSDFFAQGERLFAGNGFAPSPSLGR